MFSLVKTLAILLLLTANCNAQQLFEDIPHEQVSELIKKFLENSRKVKEFGLKIEVQAEDSSMSGGEDVESDYEILLLDSDRSKSKLVMWKADYVTAESFSSLEWNGVLFKDKRIYAINGKRSSDLFKDQKRVDAEVDVIGSRRFVRTDPMMLPICDKRSFASNGGPSRDLWKIILDKQNLLAAQSNARYVRAEFKGKGADSRSRFHIYFDKEQAGLPSMCKFFATTSPEKLFSTDFELSFYETFTQWEGDPLKGYRPIKIEMRQEDRVTATKRLLGVENWDLVLNWKFSGMVGKEYLDSSWFDLDLMDGAWDQLSDEFADTH